MANSPSTNRSAWVQLYEARRLTSEPENRPVGRPPAPVPRHKVGFTLSQGEMKELEDWQERFSVLLQRKVSLGEAIGILVRMSSARYSRISDASEMTLSQLVERMIGYEE